MLIMVTIMSEQKKEFLNHEKLAKLQDELRSLISQAEYIREQIDVISGTIQDLAIVIETLEYLKKHGEGKIVLLPIGAGNYIRARIEKMDTVIMGVGGRLSIEASPDEAKKMLEERIRILEGLRLDLLKKLEEINRRINEILPQVEKLSKEMK